MTAATTPDALFTGPAPPAEWWERMARRRDAWRTAHPVAARRLLTARVVLLWVSLLVLVVALIAVPAVRGPALLAARCWWLLLVWFLLARTRSVSWSLYAGLFSISVPWSLLVGLASTRMASGVDALGVSGAGASIGIAALTEECGKLVPLLVLAVLAPGRVRRFAAVDWLLGGVACGLAFTLVEESARLTGLGTASLPLVAAGPDGNGLPGWSPVSGEWLSYPAVTPGHHVHTALIAAAIGLAVACFRHARDRDHGRRAAWRVSGAALPMLAWWIAVSDHAAYNASVSLLVDHDRWPLHSSVPSVIGLTWQLLGHGAGRGTLLLVVLAVALLVDARRLASGDGGEPLLPSVAWSGTGRAVRADADLRRRASPVAARSTPLLSPLVLGGATLAGAILLLVAYAARDVAVVATAHARSRGEPVRFGLARGQAALVITRTGREDAYTAVLAPTASSRLPLLAPRLLALAGIALLLLLAVPGALTLAHEIGPAVTDNGGWLAGWLDKIGNWWNSLSPTTKILLGFGLAALLLLIPGVNIAGALFASGIITYLLDHANGLADLSRDPRGTTRRYLATTPPLQVGLDVLSAVLTFVPGNAFRSVGGRVLEKLLGSRAADAEVRDALRNGPGSVVHMVGPQRGAPIWTRGKFPTGPMNAYDHYLNHGTDFNSVNALDYVRKARAFVTHPPPGTLTKTRTNGETLLFNRRSETFAVVTKRGVIKTFYIPDPAKHGWATNLDYFLFGA